MLTRCSAQRTCVTEGPALMQVKVLFSNGDGRLPSYRETSTFLQVDRGTKWEGLVKISFVAGMQETK